MAVSGGACSERDPERSLPSAAEAGEQAGAGGEQDCGLPSSWRLGWLPSRENQQQRCALRGDSLEPAGREAAMRSRPSLGDRFVSESGDAGLSSLGI